MVGRSAGSPDNLQGTRFFLTTPARDAKVWVLDHRLDVAEGMLAFPAYMDSNRFLSNIAGYNDPDGARRRSSMTGTSTGRPA
jgi:hypothetical protein